MTTLAEPEMKPMPPQEEHDDNVIQMTKDLEPEPIITKSQAGGSSSSSPNTTSPTQTKSRFNLGSFKMSSILPALREIGSHITPQAGPATPKVQESLDRVQNMTVFFGQMSSLLEKYIKIVEDRLAIEKSLNQLCQEQAYHAASESGLRASLLDFSGALTESGTQGTHELTQSLNTLNTFVDTFLNKALADAKQSAKKEEQLRAQCTSIEKRIEDLQKNLDMVSSHANSQTPAVGEQPGHMTLWTKMALKFPNQSLSPEFCQQALGQINQDLMTSKYELDASEQRHERAVDELTIKVQLLEQKMEQDLAAKVRDVIKSLRIYLNSQE